MLMWTRQYCAIEYRKEIVTRITKNDGIIVYVGIDKCNIRLCVFHDSYRFLQVKKNIKKISHIAKTVENTAFYGSCVGSYDVFCIIL